MDHSREGSHCGKFEKDIFGGNETGGGFLWWGKLVLGTEGFRLRKEVGYKDQDRDSMRNLRQTCNM